MLSTLLVDDDRAFSIVAAATLSREGFPVRVAHSLHEARLAVTEGSFDLVILDRKLPDGDGLAYLPELKANFPSVVVVMVTAHGDISSAVDAIRLGALDYLAKPIELSDLVMKARRAAEDIRLHDRLSLAEGRLTTRRALVAPVSGAMKAVVSTLDRIATTSPRSPVLLLGETGSGKEALAWYLHEKSFGAAAPFVQVNCAAIPEAMAESELFGHERGAFTDARAARRGLVELAQGGTLFLDEVGELSAPMQAKLLTFLDQGRFRRLGGAVELSATARVVAATNRDVDSGSVRDDLLFRLSVFRLKVPPLRERPEDVPGLIHGLLSRVCAEQGRRELPVLGEGALERLRRYSFPGNVRELRNILERATVLEGHTLSFDWLGNGAAPSAPAATDEFAVKELVSLDDLERRYAKWALVRLGGRRLDTAKALGISHPTFNKLVRESEG